MYVCVHVYTYACMYAFIHVCMHACMCTNVRIYVYIYMYAYMCVPTFSPNLADTCAYLTGDCADAYSIMCRQFILTLPVPHVSCVLDDNTAAPHMVRRMHDSATATHFVRRYSCSTHRKDAYTTRYLQHTS